MAARARASDAKADQRRASMHQREKAAWVSVVESIGRAKADVMVAKMSWFSVDDFKKADSDNSGEIQLMQFPPDQWRMGRQRRRKVMRKLRK